MRVSKNWRRQVFGPAVVMSALVLSACAIVPSHGDREAHATALASARGWIAHTLRAGSFDLRTYGPSNPQPMPRLTVYIEGDGLAWISRSRVSPDPTPVNPVALQLALAQPDGNAVYLARPCQYADAMAKGCDSQYWTSSRFAPATIASTNRALDQLKTRFGARQMVLVGYSGGGAIALLAASRRNDVALVVTVAGNLDHAAWTRWHNISPLRGSLNPADEIVSLSTVPQRHFVGEFDRIVPMDLAVQFKNRFGASTDIKLIVEPGVEHEHGWAENWARIWRAHVGAAVP